MLSEFLLMLVILSPAITVQSADKVRSFRVDYEHNQFLKDDQPFRLIAGSFHYFRALPETWRTKLQTLKASGLNAVTTYIEWSLHNPKDGVYLWDGIADFELFLRTAAEVDLLVVLRPGPYICAERDNGGFPYWLLRKYPNMRLRTSDPDYLKEVEIWYKHVMPRTTQHLYGNGGNVIMVQVENEYGSFECDHNYTEWLRDQTKKYVDDKAVLFTTDMPNENAVRCGRIPDVFTTIDFGPGTSETFANHWKLLRSFQPKGPLMNSEYYPGWFTHWQEKAGKVDANVVAESLREILSSGASINFYMFFGGTNFGFTAGANYDGPGNYKADLTSYDYDAPMNEWGDPTEKYYILRDVIREFAPPTGNTTEPEKAKRIKLPSIEIQFKSTVLGQKSRELLGTPPISSVKPKTFEELDQYSGFVLYETQLPKTTFDPSVLTIPVLHDRAIVLVNNRSVGVLSRENLANSLPISAGLGDRLQILVENQGRINFKIANDTKGIIGDVLYNNKVLDNWTITGFPFEDAKKLNLLVAGEEDSDSGQRSAMKVDEAKIISQNDGQITEPVILHGTFTLDEKQIFDTFVNTEGWGKGVIFINGFNLGRYWPLAGPQLTLYLPRQLLHIGHNSIVVIELQKVAKNYAVHFTDSPMYTETRIVQLFGI